MVRNAIDNLPEKQRTAFVLSKYDDLSQREIANIMKISEGAVEQLLQRAKANLQKNYPVCSRKIKIGLSNKYNDTENENRRCHRQSNRKRKAGGIEPFSVNEDHVENSDRKCPVKQKSLLFQTARGAAKYCTRDENGCFDRENLRTNIELTEWL